MLSNRLGDLLDAFLAFEEVLQVDGAFQNLVQLVDVADAFRFGERQEFFLKNVAWHQHFVGSEVVEQWQSRFVRDALRDRILMEIAFFVLYAESFKCSLAVRRLVDRCSGEANESRGG